MRHVPKRRTLKVIPKSLTQERKPWRPKIAHPRRAVPVPCRAVSALVPPPLIACLNRFEGSSVRNPEEIEAETIGIL